MCLWVITSGGHTERVVIYSYVFPAPSSRCVVYRCHVPTYRDLHLQPDLESYHSAIRACMKGQMWVKAFFIMEEIRRTGRRPNQETWDLIFETCRVCGRWEAAVGVLSDMFAEEVGDDG